MSQNKLPEGVQRMTVFIDQDVKRLAKSKAVAQSVTISYTVERLLQAWLNGRIRLDE